MNRHSSSFSHSTVIRLSKLFKGNDYIDGLAQDNSNTISLALNHRYMIIPIINPMQHIENDNFRAECEKMSHCYFVIISVYIYSHQWFIEICIKMML